MDPNRRPRGLALSRFTLDTSAYVHYRLKHQSVVNLLDAADWIGVPAVVQGELWAGFLPGRRREENARLLAQFMAHPNVASIAVDGEVARVHGELALDLRRLGTPIPTNDVWIAASCICSGSTLLTFDAHFERLAALRMLLLS